MKVTQPLRAAGLRCAGSGCSGVAPGRQPPLHQSLSVPQMLLHPVDYHSP